MLIKTSEASLVQCLYVNQNIVTVYTWNSNYRSYTRNMPLNRNNCLNNAQLTGQSDLSIKMSAYRQYITGYFGIL